MFRLLLRTLPRRLPVKSQQIITPVHWNISRSLHTKLTDVEIRKKPTKFVISEEEYPPKDPTDRFGSSVETEEIPEEIEEDIQDEEENVFRPRSKRLPIQGYSRLIKEHLNAKEFKEAIDILEVRMKEDKVRPTSYIYNLLISGCAKAGYSKKSFQLYNKMKQRSLNITGATYTSLFNACAMSPWPQDGLNKAQRLREIMAEKGYEPNPMNYNAMIKAYGRCGDVKTAFLLADEMLQKKLPMKTDTFNFLLQACASDHEFGFRHALLTWHKMRRSKAIPDQFSFRLMLRCVRDCSIGNLKSMEEVIATLTSPQEPEQPALSSKSSIFLDQTSSALETVKQPTLNEAPNLLLAKPHLGSLVEINEIMKPEDRLLLLGGFTGFMEEMKTVNVTPGIETMTSLLEVIPPTNSSEKQLLSMVKKIGLKADIDFFNILMKKRAMRFDYEASKEVLQMIKIAKLQPDIVTYGVQSLTCRTQEEARELLQEMKEKGIRMNMAILGAMLRQGCSHRNFAYVYEIMQIALDERVKPNEQFLKHLDNFVKNCSLIVEQKHLISKEKHFKKNFENFERRLKIWYEEHGLENLHLEDKIKKVKGKPFEHFKTPKEEGYEQRKNEKLLNKKKARQYIKKIKIQNLSGDKEEPTTTIGIASGENKN
ncbi:PTCD1 family protein [Megaselia abdita]